MAKGDQWLKETNSQEAQSMMLLIYPLIVLYPYSSDREVRMCYSALLVYVQYKASNCHVIIFHCYFLSLSYKQP